MKIFKIAQSQTIEEIVDEAISLDDAAQKLQQANFPFEKKNLNGNFILILDYNGQKYLIDDSLWLVEAGEWIWRLPEYRLSDYVKETDFNKWFWQESGISELYHGTHRENIDAIKTKGLTRMNKSRGISNRSTGNAIFATTDESVTDSYGDVVVVIDVAAMRRDNFLVYVEKEGPIQVAEQRERLAHELGLEEFPAYDGMSSDGMWDTTVVIFNDIPPQYLKFKDKNI